LTEKFKPVDGLHGTGLASQQASRTGKYWRRSVTVSRSSRSPVAAPGVVSSSSFLVVLSQVRLDLVVPDPLLLLPGEVAGHVMAEAHVAQFRSSGLAGSPFSSEIDARGFERAPLPDVDQARRCP